MRCCTFVGFGGDTIDGTEAVYGLRQYNRYVWATFGYLEDLDIRKKGEKKRKKEKEKANRRSQNRVIIRMTANAVVEMAQSLS